MTVLETGFIATLAKAKDYFYVFKISKNLSKVKDSFCFRFRHKMPIYRITLIQNEITVEPTTTRLDSTQ